MTLVFPPIDCSPGTIRSDAAVDDLGKERELRRLRARVEELETQSVLRGDRIIPATRERDNKRHNYKCGFHPQVTVSDNTPVVECSVCESPLDPIEVLRDFAREERKFVYTVESLRREKDELTKVVEALKRERTNIRAQVRRAGGDAQAVEDEARWPRMKGPRQQKKSSAPK